MTIVVDINVLPCVFNPSNQKHSEFFHVANWIKRGSGHLVFGGSKYKAELALMPRYLKLVRGLKDAGKAVSIDDLEVDKQETLVTNETKGTICDDPHIIALLGVSRCPLLCSEDSRSFQFIKMRALYPKGSPRVRVYSGARNKNLLCNTTISSLANVV
jgi:hypothetical protein